MLPKRGEYMLKDMKRMAKYYQVPVHMSANDFQRIIGTSKSLTWFFSSLAPLAPVLPTSIDEDELPMYSLFLNLWAVWILFILSHEINFWRNMAVNDISMGDNCVSTWALLYRLWVSQDCYRGDHTVLRQQLCRAHLPLMLCLVWVFLCLPTNPGSLTAMRFITAMDMTNPQYLEPLSREFWMRFWSQVSILCSQLPDPFCHPSCPTSSKCGIPARRRKCHFIKSHSKELKVTGVQLIINLICLLLGIYDGSNRLDQWISGSYQKKL